MNPLHAQFRSAFTAFVDDPMLPTDPRLEDALEGVAEVSGMKVFEAEAAWDAWQLENRNGNGCPYWVSGTGKIQKHGRAARPFKELS